MGRSALARAKSLKPKAPRGIMERTLALMLAFGVWCPLAAHHSVLPYDGSTPTTISGTVVRIVWQNPHAYIYVDVETARGAERWTIESESPVLLERLGWSRTAIKAGDVITSLGARARNGGTAMRCRTVDLADGRRLPCFANGDF